MAVDKVALRQKVLEKDLRKLSKEEKDFLFMTMLEKNARVDDYIGTTLASLFIEGKNDAQASEAMGMGRRIFRDLKYRYIEDTIRSLKGTEIKETENQTRTPFRRTEPGFFLTNRFNPISMLGKTPAHVYIQPITEQKFVELLKKEKYEGHIKIPALCDLYNSLYGTDIQPYNEYIRYIPGDTILFIEFHGETVREGETKLPEGSELKFRYIEIDPVQMDELV